MQEGKNIEWQGKKIYTDELTYIQPGKKITIILDTRVNPRMQRLAQHAELFICESTYTTREEDKAQEYHHMTAAQAAGIAREASVKKLVLVHISQRYEGKEKLILKEAKEIFKNTVIVNDFDTLVV